MVNKRAKLNKTCLSKALIVESTKSGAIVGANDDLLTEILRRLPVTSILRFKSVSQHWHSFLSHQRFTLLYDNVPASPGLFLRDLYIPFDVENPSPPPFRRLNFYPDRSGIKIVQSCNGLLLCCSNRRNDLPRKYYVFNPTNKQFAVIPSLIGGSRATRTIHFMGLAFHPENCVHYKLVCFRKVNRYGNTFQIQMYSSDTETWRISQESFHASNFRPNSFYEPMYRVYCKGAVHWAGSKLIYFNLDTEQVQTMLWPERRSWTRGARQYYFGESEGHVHLVEDARQANPLHINVYEMLSDYSGWFVKYRVELDELLATYPCTIYQLEVVDVVRGEEEESTFMVVMSRDKIIKYNILNKSFKEIFDIPGCYRSRREFHRYTQHLTSF